MMPPLAVCTLARIKLESIAQPLTKRQIAGARRRKVLSLHPTVTGVGGTAISVVAKQSFVPFPLLALVQYDY